ncbi:MAG: hypothetical protein AMXMBFR20_11630 [Planctomycetia bacterium]
MISVLTVNYHSAEDLAQLVESLRAHRSAEPIELIVTNNSPSQHLSFPGNDLAVTVLDADNPGFAAGINRAFRASKGEFIMLANPDLQVTAHALDSAVALLKSHPDVGIVLPRLFYADGRVQPSVRRFYTWLVVLYARSPFRALGWRPEFFRRYLCEELTSLPANSEPVDVDWGLGGAMFLRRADCESGGIFDERFFLYFEDVDLCLRTWQSGRRVVLAPGIECIHAHRRSSGNPLSAAGWHHFRSMMRFVAKHGGWPQRPGR